MKSWSEHLLSSASWGGQTWVIIDPIITHIDLVITGNIESIITVIMGPLLQ